MNSRASIFNGVAPSGRSEPRTVPARAVDDTPANAAAAAPVPKNCRLLTPESFAIICRTSCIHSVAFYQNQDSTPAFLGKLRNDLPGVVDAAAPHATARLNEGRPQAGVVGQQGMRL